MFKDPRARESMTRWYEKFRGAISHETVGRRVKTRFGDTHVLVGGPGEAPPLVLLHGAMASSAHALKELWPLLERFRVYAVDVIGQSPMSADARPSVKNLDYAHWLVDVMTGLDLARAHVVGVSWGGFVAHRLAAVAPERIERLVLMVPAGVVRPSVRGFFELGWPLMWYRLAPTPARLAQVASALLTTTDDDWATYLGEAFLSYDLAKMVIPPLAKPGDFTRLEAPVLVMGADRDLSFPGAALLERVKTLFPSLAGTELLEGRHCPPTDDAFRKRLAGRVGDFLLGGSVLAASQIGRAHV
jgi:pimeloyl-ACP methyl ester carboxylesterase